MAVRKLIGFLGQSLSDDKLTLYGRTFNEKSKSLSPPNEILRSHILLCQPYGGIALQRVNQSATEFWFVDSYPIGNTSRSLALLDERGKLVETIQIQDIMDWRPMAAMQVEYEDGAAVTVESDMLQGEITAAHLSSAVTSDHHSGPHNTPAMSLACADSPPLIPDYVICLYTHVQELNPPIPQKEKKHDAGTS